MRWHLLPASALFDHVADWDRLARQYSTAVFLDSRFIRPLLAIFGSGRERLAIGESEGSIVAMALLAPEAAGVWQLFQPSQLPTGPLVLAPSISVRSAAATLLRRLPLGTVMLGLTQLDVAMYPRADPAPDLEQTPYIETAWVDVEGSFQEYWESRGKNLRQNMRKQRRKLQEEGVTLRLETLRAERDVAQAISDYGLLESAGWKATLGTAVHPDNEQGRFYRAMLEAFCAAGSGRIFRLRFDDRVVALDLCIENKTCLVVLKTTYDEQYSSVSPALLMREEAFATIWAEGQVRRIEFYGKLMDWHRRWTDQSRILYHHTQFRWPWVRTIRNALRPSVARRGV